MKAKPTMLQDDFMNDFYLGCPNCKEHICFPLIKDIFKHKPKKRSKCGIDFDWSDYKNF